MSDQGNKPAEPKPPLDWEGAVKAGTFGMKSTPRLPAEQPTKELAERVEKLGQAHTQITGLIAQRAIELERRYQTERADMAAHYAAQQERLAAERDQSLTELAKRFRDRAAELLEMRRQVERMIGGGE
jgi:hypothetical protein